MPAVLPLDVLRPGQTKKRLVDEGGGLQRVAGALPAKTASGDGPEIGHQDFKQARLGLSVAGPPTPQQFRDAGTVLCHLCLDNRIIGAKWRGVIDSSLAYGRNSMAAKNGRIDVNSTGGWYPNAMSAVPWDTTITISSSK